MNPSNLTLFRSTVSHVYEFSMVLADFDEEGFAAGVAQDKLPERFASYHPRRRREYLAGRYCAVQAITMMSTHRQILIKDKILTVGENRVPNWPPQVRGSISHSDHLVGAFAASATEYQGVGLDFEAMMTDARAERLARRVCTPKEWRKCQDLATASHPVGYWVTLTFSAKESLYKAIYPVHQQFVGFHEVEIEGVELEAQQWSYRMLSPLTPPLPRQGKGVFRLVDTQADSGRAVSMATAIAVPQPGSEP